MDTNIPLPERNIDKPLLMSVESTFTIAGRGTVVTGTIEQGKVKAGEDVELVGYSKKITKTTITGIETFRKSLDYGEAGDNIGMLVRSLTRDDVFRGQVIAKPGSLTVNQNIEANIYVLKEEEGGRKKPFVNGYRPQCFIRTADVAGDLYLPENVKMAMPGDNLIVKIRLTFPLSVQQGLRFALREGGKTVAAGVISKVLPDDALVDFNEYKKEMQAKQDALEAPPVVDAKAGEKPKDAKAGEKPKDAKAGDKAKEAPKAGDKAKEAPKAGDKTKEAPKAGDKAKEAPKAGDKAKEAPKAQAQAKPAVGGEKAKAVPPKVDPKKK